MAVRILGLVGVIAVLAGCVPETGPETGPEPVPVPGGLSAEARAACTAAGGQAVRGLAGETCARPQPDAGKACTQNSDCAGFCVAKEGAAQGGTCSSVTPFFGCHAVLVAPGQAATLCVD